MRKISFVEMLVLVLMGTLVLSSCGSRDPKSTEWTPLRPTFSHQKSPALVPTFSACKMEGGDHVSVKVRATRGSEHITSISMRWGKEPYFPGTDTAALWIENSTVMTRIAALPGDEMTLSWNDASGNKIVFARWDSAASLNDQVSTSC